MYPEMSNRDLETLNLHICNYKIHPHDNPLHIASEIGFVLAKMPLPHIDEFGQVYLISTADAEPVYQPETTQPSIGKIILAPTVHSTEKHLERLVSNPILAEYRKTAGIASHFSTEKQLKQALASLLDPDASVTTVNADILGKRQTRLGRVQSVAKDDWKAVIETATQNLPDDIVDIPQVADFYKTLGTAMSRENLQAMTASDLIQHMLTAHLQTYDELDRKSVV